MKTAFFRFFPDDWRRDCACLSPAARGLWIEFIAYAWSIGRPCLEHCLEHFSRVLFASKEEMLRALEEWQEHGTAEVEHLPDGKIRVRCRRMERDMQIQSEVRAKNADRAASAAKARWGKHARSNAPSIAPSIATSTPQGMPSATSATSAEGSTQPAGAPGRQPDETDLPTFQPPASFAPAPGADIPESEIEVIAEGERMSPKCPAERCSQWFHLALGRGWRDAGEIPIYRWKSSFRSWWIGTHRGEMEKAQQAGSRGRAARHTPEAAARGLQNSKPLTQEEMQNLKLIEE